MTRSLVLLRKAQRDLRFTMSLARGVQQLLAQITRLERTLRHERRIGPRSDRILLRQVHQMRRTVEATQRLIPLERQARLLPVLHVLVENEHHASPASPARPRRSLRRRRRR